MTLLLLITELIGDLCFRHGIHTGFVSWTTMTVVAFGFAIITRVWLFVLPVAVIYWLGYWQGFWA
jgi:hypothetical protein